MTEASTKYLEYAQLPSGQWYPKRWQETRLQGIPGKPSAPPAKSSQEFRLIVVPGMQLDKDWYVNPAEKFAERK